ncbi:hypothetical protein ACVKS2_004938, partial [Pseudomonas sp. PvP125]
PNRAKRGVPDTAQRLVLGLLRSPTQDKPARHNKPALHRGSSVLRYIKYVLRC